MDTETRPVYMLSEGHPLQTQGHIKTENDQTEKDTPCKWESRERVCIRQSRI